MHLTLLPVSVPTPRRRGRQAVSENPTERARHLDAAKAIYLFGVPVKKVAAAHAVHRQTIWRWTRAALSYEGTDADMVRRAAGLN